MTSPAPDTTVIVHGARYSVYTRIVRLTLEEKGVAYRLVEVDIFAPEGPPAGYAARHPFGRIPAFEHDGFRLFETGAITRYIDEAFSGPPLQPTEPKQRAAMNQIISIMDSYGFRTLVWDVFVERVRKDAPNEDVVQAALPKAKTILQALTDIKATNPWFSGVAPSLADLYVAPMLILFRLAPDGAALLATRPELVDWLQQFNERPSAWRTRFPIEEPTTV
jgi:glutathione S-transferase